MNKIYFFGLAIFILLPFVSKAQTVATFDNFSLNANAFWNGSDLSGGFSNGDYLFENQYTSFGGSAYAWGGFAYSNVTDTITQGYSNQFAAIAGKGYSNSVNYAMVSVLSDYMTDNHPIPSVVNLSGNKSVTGCYVTNSVYAYYSMKLGDGIAKKFGGSTGNDADWFKIVALGWSNGTLKDSAAFYLADFRFANNTEDYIVKDWKWFNLSTLGSVDSIGFILRSSDIGQYGMNTPSYFSMDNFNGSGVGIETVFASAIQIYPNPTTDFIIVQNKDNQQINTLEIYSMDGKLVSRNEVNNMEYKHSLANLTEGVYFVKVNSQSGVYTQRIVKR